MSKEKKPETPNLITGEDEAKLKELIKKLIKQELQDLDETSTTSGTGGTGGTGGIDYVAGAGYSTAANLVLYAKWTPASYTISYNGNGSTGGTVPTNTFGAGNVSLAGNSGNLVRENYYFAGWYLGSNPYSTGATYNLRANIFAFASKIIEWQNNRSISPCTHHPLSSELLRQIDKITILNPLNEFT